MRLICKLNSELLAQRFSLFLTKEKINHSCDASITENNQVVFSIWVFEEFDLEKAHKLYLKFQSNPFDKQFDVKNINFKINLKPKLQNQKKRPRRVRKPQFSFWSSSGRLTIAILLICIALFLWDELSTFQSTSNSIYSIPRHTLMFDYTSFYDVLYQITKKYSLKSEKDLEQLSKKDQQRLLELTKSPTPWTGLYQKVVSYIKKEPQNNHQPLFNKIRQGQIWRLFTPAILHGSMLHILFNMCWLLFLGNQMEHRLKFWRYFIFIIIAGVSANVAQYIMSGSQFLGFSGVICGMITFIWMRQKEAPLEGYFLPHSTFVFISAFVLIMLGIQVISFLFEVSGSHSITMIKIGNTSHLTGALAGIIMAKIPFFRKQT